MIIEAYCNEEEFVPVRSTSRSIGYDVFSPIDFKLKHGEAITVDLGLVLHPTKENPDEMNWGYFILPRASSCKTFMSLVNTVGVIEPDYSGPNDSLQVSFKFEDLDVAEGGYLGRDVKVDDKTDRYVEVKKGERIAQLVFVPILLPPIKYAGKREDHPGSEDRGGFGSSGK
jgi:dUTP pyrophosphatase